MPAASRSAWSGPSRVSAATSTRNRSRGRPLARSTICFSAPERSSVGISCRTLSTLDSDFLRSRSRVCPRTAPGACGRRRRSRTPAATRLRAARLMWKARSKSAHWSRIDASEGLGSSGGASRPCLKSLTSRRLPGIDEATSGDAQGHRLEQGDAHPLLREGRTNRSAVRSARFDVGRRRPAARPLRQGPAVRPMPGLSLQRGPLGPFADQGQPGRG